MVPSGRPRSLQQKSIEDALALDYSHFLHDEGERAEYPPAEEASR
jgi:hypothetical protein